MNLDDTIVAIATPPGRGGIGVVRLSGPEARAIAGGLIAHARPLEARHATFTLVRLRTDSTYGSATCGNTTYGNAAAAGVVSGFSRTVSTGAIDHVVVT